MNIKKFFYDTLDDKDATSHSRWIADETDEEIVVSKRRSFGGGDSIVYTINKFNI